MVILKDVLPSLHLQEYVRKHQIIRFKFGTNEVLPFKAYVPRPEQCLVFYLRDLQNVGYSNDAPLQKHPQCTLNGQHTLLTNRYIGRDFWALQIVLQPTALFRLTGLPSSELTNTFIDAEAIWGSDIRSVHEEISNLDDPFGAILLAERFLEKLIKKSKRPLLGVDKVAQVVLSQNKTLFMDTLADDACLSVRQFHRVFTERVGVSPKTFDRITRFEKAVKFKNAQPHKDWLTIALELGYYDYQHLVRDFKEFTHLTPNGFLIAEGKAPERAFGVAEV
ncbi:MAG: helix-turn-helix domain-containing protein [Bacteroidetes bacterium]|nr:helix-turn-helix domain-containing protein [Bacteroidota bacterium]